MGYFSSSMASSLSPNYGLSHFGAVKYFRKEFKEYSNEEFRNITSEPMVKDILSGLSSIPKEEIAERIRKYLDE